MNNDKKMKILAGIIEGEKYNETPRKVWITIEIPNIEMLHANAHAIIAQQGALGLCPL